MRPCTDAPYSSSSEANRREAGDRGCLGNPAFRSRISRARAIFQRQFSGRVDAISLSY
jgi:hypothetical protein